MTHLALVAVLVPDYADGPAFFVDTLGFDLIEDTDLGNGKRWVCVGPRGGQTRILIARAIGTQKDTIGQQGGGRVWLFLQTDSFARDYATWTSLGVHFEEAPRTEAYGTVAVFRDPWGNRWDLIEPA